MRLEIEEEEPAVYRIVDLMAQDDECAARGLQTRAPLKFRHRVLAYWVREPFMRPIRAWRDEEQKQTS